MQPELEADRLLPFSFDVMNGWRKSGTDTGFSPSTSLSLSLHHCSTTVYFKIISGQVK
jgi:hypothetical protein